MTLEGLQPIGALALGLLLVYLGTRLNRRLPRRARAAAGDTAVSSGDGSHDSKSSGAFLLWLGHGQDSKSGSQEPGGSGDSGGGWGDSGGDGGGGGGGD